MPRHGRRARRIVAQPQPTSMRARRYTGVVRRAFRASQRLVWLRCVVGGPLLATVAVPTFCRRQPRQRACAPAALRHVGRDLRSARPPGVRRVANRDAVDAAAGAAVLAVAVPILGSPAGRCLEPQAARASLHGLSTLRDPVHGDIELTRDELRLVDTAEFQRLRGIKQLGSAALVYPGAVHTRFEHSIGTLHVCDRLLDACNKNASRDPAGCHRVTDDERRILRAAALLHDVTHIPYGHNIEDQTGLLPRHDLPERFEGVLGDTELNRVSHHAPICVGCCILAPIKYN